MRSTGRVQLLKIRQAAHSRGVPDLQQAFRMQAVEGDEVGRLPGLLLTGIQMGSRLLSG